MTEHCANRERGNVLVQQDSDLLEGFLEGYPMGTVSGKPAPDVDAAASALQPFSSGLAADGYSLVVTAPDGEGLVVEIVAGPDACEDCLIPKEMFVGMLSARLGSEEVAFSELTLVYPTD